MSIQSATSGSSASALSPARVSYRLPLLLAPCAAFRYRGVLSTAASAFWATVAVRYRAQSSRSALGTRAASPVALHRGNPSSAPAACDSIAPVPDAALLTSGQHPPASGRSASSTVPMLPKPVSNIAQWIPSLLPRPPAPRTIPIAIAGGQGWYQTGASQNFWSRAGNWKVAGITPMI